jgi:glycosyltransferase involved in cell wall biosynthesis
MLAGRDYSRRLRRSIAELKPGIVHSNALKSHLFAALGGSHECPLIWHVRDFLGTRPIMSHVLKRVSSSVSRAVGISEAVGRDVRAALPGLPVDVVYNAIDVDHFHPGPGDGDELDRLAGLPPATPGTVRVGLIATFARWKGQDLLIDTAARIGTEIPSRFYIIGGPIYKTKGSQFSEDELRSLADRRGLGDRVGFIPFQSDTAEIYRSLDVVVQASTKPEPFGRTIVEAMATGRAVAVSNGGGAAELFREGCDGVGFTPGSSESLCDAVARLIADPGLRERLGRNARSSAVDRFHRGRLGPDVLRVYDQALSGR